MKIGRYAIGPTPRDCPCTSAHAMGRKPEAGARVNHRRCPTDGAACTGTYLRPALRRGIRSSGLDTADDAALDVRCWWVVSTGRRNTLSWKEKMECGMERRFHRGFTAAEKTELWDRWKRGESLKAIGRAFGKPSSSIYFLVAPHGGIRPAERRRSG